MKRKLLVGLIAALSIARAAWADLEEGSYAPDIVAEEWLNTESGQPVSLAQLKGMAVVLYFWVSWHDAGAKLMPLINQVENMAREHGVFTMGVTEADRARVEDVIKKERIFFPIALESKAADEYKLSSFPSIVIIDPQGKVFYSGWPDKPEGILDQLQKLLEETPPFRTHPREAREAYRLMDRAREALLKEDYNAAYDYARKAYGHALTDDPLKTRCQQLIDLVEALGRDQLIRGLNVTGEQRYQEGARLLREVSRRFRILKAGKIARQFLRYLEKNYPDVKRALETLDRDDQARRMLAEAAELLWQRSFGEAYQKLEELDRNFGDTTVADQARQILRRMKRHEAVMAQVRDFQAQRDCENWLAQARNYIKEGNRAKAEELLRKIIREHPQTKYEEEAWRLLGQLP